MALTAKQERFCQEYLIDHNASQAAIRSGYGSRNANVTGPRVLANVGVRARIAELTGKQATRLEIKADTVLKELLLLAKSDVKEIFDENGNLKAVHEIPEDVRRAIAGVETFVDKDGDITKKIKLWDKPKALEMLGRHLKLFTDKVEHSGKVTFDLNDMSDEELDAEIETLKKELKRK